jgi:hypothetical protein
MENTETSTTMANPESAVLVFKDEAGSYFLLPLETLEQGRVLEEQKAAIEQLIAEQQDVQGYLIHLFVIPHILRTAAVIATGAVLVGQEATKDEGGTMTNAQFVQLIIDQGRGR